jgi:two-component system OmpR family response regulator
VASKRIFLVDDDDRIREIVADILTRAGYEVHGTGDPKTAVALATEKQPDLAILDIMMPDVDGFQVAFGLRDNPKTAKIPFLFLTARSAAHDAGAARDVGAAAYLEKPFKKDSLLAIVAELLSSTAAHS